MIRDLNVGEELQIPKEGKFAVMFHIPGHCAGCKRALSILQKLNSPNWDIILVDADNNEFAELVASYHVQTAPTIVCYEDGEVTKTIAGLKEFLENMKMFE